MTAARLTRPMFEGLILRSELTTASWCRRRWWTSRWSGCVAFPMSQCNSTVTLGVDSALEADAARGITYSNFARLRSDDNASGSAPTILMAGRECVHTSFVVVPPRGTAGPRQGPRATVRGAGRGGPLWAAYSLPAARAESRSLRKQLPKPGCAARPAPRVLPN